MTDRDREIAPAHRALSRSRLAVEFVAVFVLLPASLVLVRSHINYIIVPLIILAALICCRVLCSDKSFDRRRLLSISGMQTHLVRMLVRFIVLGTPVAVVYALSGEDRFLQFPRQATLFWGIIMFSYPIFSAFPQELIFRSFLFHRYEPLFGDGWKMMIASAISFGLAHLFLLNWVAPMMSAVGGLLFANTYRRSGSLLTVSLEHGLWGDLLFTLGLGWYFYGGSVG